MNTLKFNQIEFNHIGEQPTSSIKLQEKSVTITENGTTEVVPDSGYALEKVKVEVKNITGGSPIKEGEIENVLITNNLKPNADTITTVGIFEVTPNIKAAIEDNITTLLVGNFKVEFSDAVGLTVENLKLHRINTDEGWVFSGLKMASNGMASFCSILVDKDYQYMIIINNTL